MATCRRVKFLRRMFSVLVIRLRSLRLLRVSGIVMRLRMFLLLNTFLKASHSFRRSEERRVGKSVDLGGRRIIKKKKEDKNSSDQVCNKINSGDMYFVD